MKTSLNTKAKTKAFGIRVCSGIGNGISGGTGLGVSGGLGMQGGLNGGRGYIEGLEMLDKMVVVTATMEVMMRSQYGVHDEKYYTDFTEERSGDEAGDIKGEYTLALPNDKIQHFVYHADGTFGATIMEVTYKGGGRHPDVIHH